MSREFFVPRKPAPSAAPAPGVLPLPASTHAPTAHASATSGAHALPPRAEGEGERKESRLIVGPDIKLKGVEITDCDTLVVEGRVEASLDSRVIQIAEHGTFCGTVAIDVADIRGHFEGEITARKQLVVHASARMNGKIRYGALKVEEGAQLTGELSSLGGVAPLPAAPPKRVA